MYVRLQKATLCLIQTGDYYCISGKGSLSRNKIGNLEKRENPNIITIDQTQSKFENIGLFEEKSDARIKKNL